MGKIFKTLTLILFLVCAMTWVTSCEKEPDEKTDAKTEEKTDVKTEEKTETIDYGTLSISDIKVEKGKTADINPVFSISDKAEEITYTFDGNNISIEKGKVTGLVGETETVVTAKTLHHEITFKVVVWIDYGTLSIADINVTFGSETLPIVVFSKEEYEEDVEYQFEGNNISITDGVVKGLVPDTTTVVTAKTQHHEAKFNVNVSYVNGVLTNDIGDESKLGLPTPTNADNYLFLAKVNVDAYRVNGWTRLSAFAYNESDNSWYNIEMNEAGNVMLYARFNGVEKYHIFLFNINEEGVLVDGKFSYDVAILKVGQSTKLFVNE